MAYKEPPIIKGTDKFIGYCAVTPNKAFMKLFERARVQNVLISYHYIRKNPALTYDFLQQVRDLGGLFMTDSGAFSFLNDPKFDVKSFDWLSYLEEYTEWLDKHRDYIFSACNLDVDAYVGHDKVVKWNDNFFKDLENYFNVIYVAHKNVMGMGDLDAFNEYVKQHDYIAVNESLKNHASAIYQTSKREKTAVHGLAWTKPTLLDDSPFFSVDSSTWVNYQKFGATPVFDGTNFKQYDKDDKHIRATLKNKCANYGVSFYEFQFEKDPDTGKHNDKEGLTFSLRTWLDTFQHVKKFARTKLNITVNDMLDGKATVFQEAEEQTPTKKSKLSSLIEGRDGINSTESNSIVSYEVADDGSEVAMYQKRGKKLDFNEFIVDNSVMVCNFCHIQDKCPQFREESECAFDFEGKEQDPLSTINQIIKIQTGRVNRAMMIEKMEGGNINKIYSQELATLDRLNQSRLNIITTMHNGGAIVSKTIIQNIPADGGHIVEEKPKGFLDMLSEAMKQ